MAERGYTPVSVVSLFKGKQLAAGGAGTSDVIDLRFIAQQGIFSLAHKVHVGTAGTTGTTIFTYVGCSTETGTFITPHTAVAIGTAGTNATTGTANIWTFEPEPMPFMKIIATQTGVGGTGKDSRVTAELIVQ
jgi:hypothetical protein